MVIPSAVVPQEESEMHHYGSLSLAEAARAPIATRGHARITHKDLDKDVVLGIGLVGLLDKIPRRGIKLENIRQGIIRPGTNVELYTDWVNEELIPAGLVEEHPEKPGSYRRTKVATSAKYDVFGNTYP